MAEPAKWLNPRFYLKREPMLLAGLSAMAIAGFLAVAVLVRIYHAQQNSLGERWFGRGVAELKTQRFDHAAADFRTALIYSRDNFLYQLNLAQALIGLRRGDEAYAYLINLWDQQPEHGVVNLELARVAAAKGDTEHALRYYHNAIYATWPGDEETERKNTRLELIGYLLKTGAKPQAEAELVALAANAGDDPAEQEQLGDLFMQVQDYERALSSYRTSLKEDHGSARAAAGAGFAAFELARYPLAQHYLQMAVAENPSDADSARRLKTTDEVVRMDPFRRQISAAERYRVVMEAYEAAGDRLKACGALSAPEQNLNQDWAKLKPNVSERGLQHNPDLVNQAMELVFKVERQTAANCGAPTQIDSALLLIARLHEGG
ncbi:MAG TPA: tetratricopeptide repeat protein [Terriglobales bacterium]